MSDLARPLADSAARMFADRCTPEVVNAAERGEWPADLWRTIDELELTKVLVAEAHGGAGGDWSDACALLKCAGAYSVPAPIAETLYARWLLDRARIEAPPGPLTIAFLNRAEGFERSGGAWRITARTRGIPWAARSTAIVLVAEIDESARVLCVPTQSVVLVPGRALSGEPRDAIELNTVRLPADAVSAENVGIDFAEAYACAALCRAAMIGGALKRVLTLSVTYARERVQFGRPLAAFQAIQQNLAVLAEEVAATGIIVDVAARAYGTEGVMANIAAAKVQAGAAAGLAARIAHQIHGAMGVTFEHSLHQSTRRLWTWRDEYGGEEFWARRLADVYQRRIDAGVWATLVASTNFSAR